MGQIITFYSYKGGVGRTMALANIAVILAQKNKKVLIIDWDLEAPGLEYYFTEYVDMKRVEETPGVIDLLNDYNQGENGGLDWHDCIVKFSVKRFGISLITSGQKKIKGNPTNYFSLVQNLDVSHFYEKQRGGDYIERLRSEWKNEYDFVLVDSRTGITDIGGICTIQLPDILFLLYTANEQSLSGIVDVAEKANAERKKLPYDRYSLTVFPLASRFDGQAEFEISQKWLNRFSFELKKYFSNWLPQRIDCRTFIESTKIPYVPYFSFGEKLPIIEQGSFDPASLGFAYNTIATIIAEDFETIEQFFISDSKVKFRDNIDAIEPRKNLIISDSYSRFESNYKYDVFISYSHKDAEWVTHTLVPRLESAGIAVCIDSRDFVVGRAAELNRRDGIIQSHHVLLVLTPNWTKSSWNQMEAELALSDDPNGVRQRMIPLMLKKCQLPDYLARLTWVDFTDNNNADESWVQLLRSLGAPEKEIVQPRPLVRQKNKSFINWLKRIFNRR